ncbi:MAG: hypothetical protein A3F16_07775 [Deltaproteobacteria bacterium RIFCSPHIGHO2_12_FULL_43_9]|nr:MAG: hypothetical protein A3F16_07775 [Deltaproteobacteria bacterium RIFCSPHIGHO2_12_FULL_43_9]
MKHSTKFFFWGAIVVIAAVALVLTLFQPPSGIYAPPADNITKDKWLEVVARSRSATAGQLFAIPNRNVLIEEPWLFEENISHFYKQDLERYLKEYGTTLDELKSRLGSRFIDKGDVVEVIVGKTIHRYPHDYDINIPLIFYGPGYIVRGKFEKFVTHQHIVPTLAAATGGPMPIGARGEPLREIFTKEARTRYPKAIVLISIDMGGDQYFWAHPDATPNIDFIRGNGADFLNAQVSHLDVETGPGHAAIGTGSYPANSDIYGNYVWREAEHEASAIYSKENDSSDPSDLKVSTFADVFDRALKNKPVVVSYCFAARAAIGMAGHGAQTEGGDKDLVLWLANKTFNPTTNQEYYAELTPEIVSLSAVRNFIKEYPSGHWMGHAMMQSDGEFNKYNILSSPAQVRFDGNLVLSLLDSQQIGKDNVTDLVFITFKATDYAGHEFGWESIEAKEAFRETDEQIGRIKNWLGKNSPDEFILIITADHGAAPLPEFTNGTRVDIYKFADEINKRFDPSGGRILLFAAGNSYLFDEEKMKKLNVTFEGIKEHFLQYTKDGKKIFDSVYLLPEIEAEQKRLLKRR